MRFFLSFCFGVMALGLGVEAAHQYIDNPEPNTAGFIAMGFAAIAGGMYPKEKAEQPQGDNK